MFSGENKMDLVNKLAQAGSWHPYCWHLPWAHQKGNYKFTEALLLFFIQNAASLHTMFFSLNPQGIDSPAPIFQKYLNFSSVFFLNSSHAWFKISADTIHCPQKALVNHKALLYIWMTLESQGGREGASYTHVDEGVTVMLEKHAALLSRVLSGHLLSLPAAKIYTSSQWAIFHLMGLVEGTHFCPHES